MLTVRELLAELEVSLRAGEGGLDAPVRWVHTTELPDPTPWLSGGEVLLTSGLQLERASEQRAFVARLADHGLAALGVGVGLGHDEVPPAMIDEAQARAFPLFEVPYDTPFIAVTERAFTRLVNESYELLPRSIAAQEQLQRIVLSERGLEAVAGVLAALVGGAVLVYDGRGKPLARHTFRRDIEDAAVAAIGAELRERTRRADGNAFVPVHEQLSARALALPVPSGGMPGAAGTGRPQAWLVAVKDQGGLSELDRLLLQQAVTAVALELLRLRVADTTERRLAGDVLSELIAGDVAGPELHRRLEPFGLGGRVTALVLHAGEERGATARAEAALVAALREDAVSALVATHGQLACALMPGLLDEELFEVAERVHARVRAQLGGAVHAAAGRAVPAVRARETFHEARCALEAHLLGHGDAGNGHRTDPAHLATYRDLGSFALLLSLQDSDALRLFCESVLGPIEAGEGHYGGELVRSLEAFIECNGQWEAAARRLVCHRHTLRYRIRKVEELTGRDLASARDRIEFWLALRGRELTAGGARARTASPVP
ncbi:MAG: PucR family transcriptional regulator [Solirubrobacterales bacterium]|nr:PucR family transcriptional regulator [Solirubrobacterales bacterium]